MSQRRHLQFRANPLALASLVLIGLFSWQYVFTPAYGARLGPRFLQLSTDEVSATAAYNLSFQLTTAGLLGSIDIQFCSNDPLIGDPCTAPAGFDASSAVLASQSGPTGFIISPASTANDIILTRAPVPAAVGTAAYDFTGVTNP